MMKRFEKKSYLSQYYTSQISFMHIPQVGLPPCAPHENLESHSSTKFAVCGKIQQLLRGVGPQNRFHIDIIEQENKVIKLADDVIVIGENLMENYG